MEKTGPDIQINPSLQTVDNAPSTVDEYRIWLNVFRVEMVLIGIILNVITLFDTQFGIDPIGSWKVRVVLSVIGGILIVTGAIVGLPSVSNYIKRDGRESKFIYFYQAISWCLVSFFVMELVLRVTIHNPGLYVAETSWFGTIYSEDSVVLFGREGYGLVHYGKMDEVRTPINRSEKDVIVLGDSMTLGRGVSDADNYSSIAEMTLSSDGHNFDLHNFGSQDANMADYISWVPLYKSVYDVKAVVVQFSELDIYDSSTVKTNYFILRDNKIVDFVHKYDLHSNFMASADKLYVMPALFREGEITLYWHRRNAKVIEDVPDQASNLGEFNSYLVDQQLRLLINACNGVPLIVVLLPTAPYISGDQIQMVDPGYERLREYISLHYPEITIVDPLQGFQKLVMNGHFPRGFSNSTPDSGHLNIYGHEIVGNLLAKAIEKVLK